MGLLYNNKKKSDLVVLSEEKLENPEGQAFGFELIPGSDASEKNTSTDRVEGCEANVPLKGTPDNGK